MEIVFEIPIEPRAQKRDRIGTFGGHGRSYKSKEQSQYEGKVAALIAQHRPERPLEGALELQVICYLPIPVSKSKKWKAQAIDYTIRPTTKPDWDNIGKNITDVMTGVFFKDDKQIVYARVEKGYSDLPRWEISIWDQ